MYLMAEDGLISLYQSVPEAMVITPQHFQVVIALVYLAGYTNIKSLIAYPIFHIIVSAVVGCIVGYVGHILPTVMLSVLSVVLLGIACARLSWKVVKAVVMHVENTGTTTTSERNLPTGIISMLSALLSDPSFANILMGPLFRWATSSSASTPIIRPVPAPAVKPTSGRDYFPSSRAATSSSSTPNSATSSSSTAEVVTPAAAASAIATCFTADVVTPITATTAAGSTAVTIAVDGKNEVAPTCDTAVVTECNDVATV